MPEMMSRSIHIGVQYLYCAEVGPEERFGFPLQSVKQTRRFGLLLLQLLGLGEDGGLKRGLWSVFRVFQSHFVRYASIVCCCGMSDVEVCEGLECEVRERNANNTINER